MLLTAIMTKLPVKIYYRDTDCGGVVYYANYLDYFERGRTEFMAERGVDITATAREGIKFIVRSASVEYLSPARYGDTIIVETSLGEMKGASFSFLYEVTCSSTGKTLVRGETLVACIDGELRPRRIPPDIVSRLKN